MPWVWKTSVKLVGDPPKKVSYNHKVWVKPPPESKKSAKAAARDSKKPKPKPKPQPTPINNKAIQLQQLDLARSKAAVGAPKQPQKQPPVGSIVPQRDSIQDYKVDIARQRTPSIVNTVWDTIGQRSQEFFDSYRIKVGSQGLTIAQRDMNDPVIKKREADNIRAIRDRAIRDQTAAQKKASDSAWLDQVANTNMTDFRGDGLKTHTPIPDDGKKIESLYDEVFRATDKGAAIDPAYIEKLDKAWQNYVENVALTYNRAVDEVLVWWRVDDEGNLVLRKKPKKGMKANIERAEAALSNEALTTAGAEYTRLMGGTHLDKKGNTVVDEGLLKAWGDKRENLAKVQRDRLFKEAQDTVFNTTRVQLQHGDIRGAIATVREAQGTQYMFDAAKDTIDPARTGWTWSDTPDPVTGRRERQRTVEEEFEYRRTLYMAEMERQIKEAEKHADLQRLSRILTDNGYAAKDLPGIAAIAKQFGYNDVSSVYRPQDVEKIVDRAMLDWDDTNRRIYLGPGFEGLSYEEIAKRLRTSVSPWNPNQYNPKLLEYATARRAVVDRYYNYFGMQERSLFDRPLDLKSEGGGSIADNNAGQWAWDMTLGKLPDMLNGVLAPFGLTVGGLNTAATAAAGAPTNWLGAWDNLDYKKFPREQQKKVDALVQTIMNDPTWFSRHPEFGHAPPIAARGIYREKALAAALHIVAKEFMKTPEGDKWSIDRNQMTGGLGWTTGRNSEERAEFLKEGQSFWDNFYGEGGDKIKGLAEASTSLFTEDSAAYEMIVGFGLDPLNLIPMNALTYVARSKYAINALKTLPGKQKALAPWKWITVSDAELKVGRAFKKLATRLDAGEDPNKIVAEFAELLSGVHGKSQQERMVKDFFIKYGINPRNASEHQFFTLVQDLATKMAEVKKIPIESVAAVARKKNEALIAAREAARAADPKIVAADAAHAAKVAAAELEVKAGAAHVESVVTVRSRLQGRAERLATQRSERIAAQPAPSVHVPHEPVAGASPAEVVSTQVPYSPDPVVAAVQKANRDRAFKRVPFTRRGIPIVRRTGSRTPDASPRTVFEDDAFSTGRDTILDREPTFSMRQGTEILYGETFRMGGAEKFLKTPAGVRVTEIIGLAEPTDPLAKPLWEAQRLEAAMIIREEAKRSMSEFEREMEGIAGHLNARGELIFDRGAVVDSERSAANQFIPDRSAVWDRGGVRDELSGEQLNHAMVKWQETKVALLRLQQSHEAGRLTDEQFRERYLEMLGESYFSYGNTRINYGDILLNDLQRRRADAALDAARGRIRPKVVEWQKYITKISDAYEDYVKRAEATRETIEAGAQDALRRGQHPGDVARARAKKLEELRKAEMRNAEIYRDAMSDALSEERALLASVDPVLPTFTGSDLNNMYSTFTLLREFGDDAPIDEFKYRVYGAMDPMDPDFRDGFSAVQFAKHFRANFMIPPSGPDDFRERGDFLFRLFHMTLLDTGSKHSGRMDEYRRVIEGILSEPGPKKGEVFDAVEGTNGLTASLDTLYRRTFTTPVDQTVFARMWQVMETRAGLPGSATFIGAEDAFIESIMRSGIEPTLHPTLALMTIPHGPIARKVPTSFGLPRLLAEIPYSKSKNNLFSAPPIGYDDVFALSDIKRIGSGAVKDVYEGVRLAAHVIQYQAIRLGGPKRRASFNARLEGWGVHNALLDVHVRKPVPDGAPRGTQGDLLLPQNAEGVEELRRRWIARAEAEHPSSTPEALFARRAQFDKLFDDQMKTIAPKKGETRLVRNPDYDKNILKDFVELYWEGKISVTNPSMHTLMLYTKLLDPHVQRGTQWEKFYRVYMRNMTQIGHKDVADEVAGWIFLPQRKSRMHTAWESIYGIEGKAAAKDDAWQQEGKDIFEEFGLAPSRESLIERVKNTTIVDSAEAEKGNAAMRDDFAAAGKRKGEDESAGHFTEGSIEEASDRVMAGIENLRAGIPTDPVLRLEADAADLIPVKGEWDPVLDEVFMEMAREKGWDVTRINAARFSSAPGVRPGGGRLTNEWMDFYERVAPQIYEEAQLREIRGGLASLVRRTNGVTGLTDESEQLLKDTIAAVHGLGDEGDKILRSLGNAQGEFIVDSRIGQILAHHDFFAPRVAPAWVERKARREITALIGAERQRLTALGHTAEDLKDLHVDRPGDVRKRMAEGVDIDRAPDRGRPKPDSVPKDDPRRLAAKAYLGRVKAVHLSNIKRAKRISELEALLKRGRIVNHKRVAVTPARKKVIEAAIASLKSAEGTLHSSVKIEPLQHTVDAHGVVKSISATLPPRPSATQVRELQTLEKRLAAAEAEYKRLQAMRKRGDAIPAGPRPTTTSIKKMRDEIAAMKVKHEEMLNLRADVQGLLEEIKNFEAMTKIEVYSKEFTAAMKEANDDEAMAILRKIDEAAALLPDTQKTRVRQVVEEVREDLTSVENPPPAAAAPEPAAAAPEPAAAAPEPAAAAPEPNSVEMLGREHDQIEQDMMDSAREGYEGRIPTAEEDLGAEDWVPPVPPTQASLTPSGLSRRQRTLNLLSGMSEEEWLNYQLLLAKRQRDRAKTGAKRHAAWIRIKHIKQAQLVAELSRTGMPYYQYASRRRYARLAIDVLLPHVEGTISPQRITSYFSNPAAIAIERGRVENRMRKRAVVISGGAAPDRTTGVSANYTSMSAASHATVEKDFLTPLRPDQLSAAGLGPEWTGMSPLSILHSADEMIPAVRDTRFRKWLSHLEGRMQMHLDRYSGDPNYSVKQYLADRTNHGDVLGEAFERGDAAIVAAREAAGLPKRRTWTDLPYQRGEPGAPEPDEVGFELIDNDPREIVAKARALAEQKIDLHEYNETRKVLRPGLVRELAAKRIQKEMYPLIFADLERLGVRIDDRVRWDKEWQKSWDFHLDEIRNRMAREETYSKLGQFAFEEGFDRPLAQLLRDFEALYGLTNEILPGKPLEISHFQKRTLDRAVEAHLGIDSVDDPDALMIGLRRHGQHPPDFDNRGSRREWLVKYGFFTPRTKEMIESGKKSWSIEDEAQWWDDNWGYIPPDTDPALYAEGGPRNGIAHDEIEYLDQMKADGVYKTNMQARYAQSTMSREERIKLYVYGDKTLEIEPSRDLELERRYVFERFGDLFSEEMSDGSRRLKAFPWLMNESEYRGYVMERTGKGIADELLQDVFELHEVTRAINVALNPRLDAILKRGTPMTHEDVLTMCVEITEELLKNPEWLRRSRDVGGDFIRLQGKVRRGLVMTMFGFGTTNFLDSGIRTGWMAFRDRGIMTPPHLQSAFAGSLELAHAGLEHGTQLVRTRVDLGTTRIWKGWHGDHPILDTITGIGTIPLQMSAAAERAGKLRLLRGMYDEVYALALREISDPDIAKLAALKECGDRIAKMWPTAGDSSVSRLWNDLFPFFSYQFKNHVLFLGELATHPVLYNHLQRIGDYIESVNTQNWINSHPKDQPPDPKLMRLIELPWAPDEFIDFGEWTDFQRGVKPAYDVIEGKATPKSLVSQFVRLVSANDQNMFSGVLNALHLGQKKMWLEIMGEDGWGTGEFEWVEVPIEAPWGGVANAFLSIWPLQMASDWIEAQKDGNVSVQELTRIAYSFMFMGSLKSYDKTAALNAYYMTLPSKYAKEQFLLTDNGKILKNWWQDSAAQPNFLKYPKELKEIMDPNIHVDPNPWFHAKSPEYQSAVKRALSEKWSMMRSWDHKISQLMPGSKELRDAKLQRATEYYAFYGTHPILYEYDAFSMTPDEWAAKTDQFQTDLLVETFFNIKAPLRDDFASEEAYQRALANWKRARAIFLGAFPKVAEALQGSKNALEMQQAGQEEGWFRVLEEIGTRDIAMQAAREAEDFPLLDQLYIVKNLQFAKLEEEQIGFYFNETTDYKQIEVFGREVKVKASPSLIPHVRILPDFNAWRWERANAEKRQEILDKKRYGQGMAKVIFKAKKAKNFGASFVRQLKKDPWLLEQYFAQPGNENKKAEWALNDKYISIISRYGKLMEAGRFDAGYAYFESMPDWVKVRYFDAHPGRAKKMAETQEYMRWMKKWVAFFKRRDYEGGSAFFDTMPKWVQERYRKNNPKYGDAKGGSSPYSRAMGGWVQLLKDGKKDEAKKYFDALPQEFKDRYYSNHPEARLRDDLKRIGQLAYYFGADDANRAQYLENNPEFAKWLKNNTKSAEQRKMLITAAYRSIPKEDEWLRRVFRERYPEVFSLGAIGQAKLAKVDKYLAEHPEMNPIFEKWVNAILASYAEEQKHVKAAPRPLVKDYSRQQQHGVDRRVPPHKPKSAAWVRLHSI